MNDPEAGYDYRIPAFLLLWLVLSVAHFLLAKNPADLAGSALVGLLYTMFFLVVGRAWFGRR